MFDVAWSEILLVAILALVFIGPKELPYVLNTLGKSISKLRRSADDFRQHFEESMREAGYEDLQKNLQDFRQLNPANQLRNSIDRAINQEFTSPAAPIATKPESQPTAALEQDRTADAAPPPGVLPHSVPAPEAPNSPTPASSGSTSIFKIDAESLNSLRPAHQSGGDIKHEPVDQQPSDRTQGASSQNPEAKDHPFIVA